MLVRRRVLFALLLVGAACAKPATTSTSAPTPSTATTGSARPRKNPDVISREELRDPTIAGTDALTAIRQPVVYFNREESA